MPIGETDLPTLLSSLKPTLQPTTYVFTTIPQFTAPFPIPLTDILMWFREAEGITLIIEKHIAEKHAWEYTFPCRLITLTIHSSLEAVGMMAHITSKLAEQGLSCNPVSAYFHDHLFVDEKNVEQAMTVLREMSKGQ